MRRVLIALGSMLLATGCGSENKASESGSVGIPLSISGNQGGTAQIAEGGFGQWKAAVPGA